MSPRTSAIALSMGATAAGLVLPRLSEQQLQAATLAAFWTLVVFVIADSVVTFVRSRP